MNKKRAVYALLLLIVIYTIVYSVSLAIGPSHMGDDLSYSFLAYRASTGTFIESSGDILSVRILQIMPIGFFYKFFGADILTSAAWDITSFALSVILVFLIGKELYDDHVGLLAAFLLSIFPLVAVYSTTMSDNIPMMFFVCLAVFTFIKARKTNSRLWVLAAGAAVVAPPLAMPEGFELWVILGIFVVIELARKKLSVNLTTLFFVYGFIVAMFALVLFNYINTGISYITFSANLGYYSQTWRPDLTPLPVDAALSFYPSIMFPYQITGNIYQGLVNHNPNLITIFGSYLNNMALAGFFFYAFVPAALYLFIRKDKNSYFPLFWFFAGILYLEFGPQSIGLNPFTYVLSHRLDRYLTLISPPLVIIISAALITAVRTAKKKWKYTKMIFCSIVVLFLTATSLQIVLFTHSTLLALQYPQLQAAKHLQALPNTTKIYTDTGFRDVAVYMNFNNLSRFYFGSGVVAINCSIAAAGSYVLLPTQFQNPLSGCSSNWKLVLSPQLTNFSQLVSANSQQNLADLYYVPKS